MPKRFLLLTTLLVAACAPSPTPAPPPTPTPIAPADDLAIYRPALAPANQGDLAHLDYPTRYALTLTYDHATPTLWGSAEVRYSNRQSAPLNEIYFRLFANYPDSGGKIVVARVTANGTAVTPTLQAQNTALRVPLAEPLAPGAAITLRLDLAVTIPRHSDKHYADFTANDDITTLPTIYPLIPAYDNAGWHLEISPTYGDWVYADASLYAVTLTTSSTLTVIASGTTIDRRENDDATTTWRIVGAPMRDFHLVLANRLEKVSATVGDVTVNSWYEPADAAAGTRALQVAVNALRTFNDSFGAYPYRELDVVETPTTAGGIEYPGLIVIGRALYQNQAGRDVLEFVIAHEVAHQWWYAVVGNDQVNAPWVDEALAQYSALLYFEKQRGASARQTIAQRYFEPSYNAIRTAGRDAPADRPVAAYSEDEYVGIVYGKAPLFFDAIRTKMGDAKFFEFLRTYYERHRYKVVFPDAVLKTAQEACACDLSEEYQRWIAGK